MRLSVITTLCYLLDWIYGVSASVALSITSFAGACEVESLLPLFGLSYWTGSTALVLLVALSITSSAGACEVAESIKYNAILNILFWLFKYTRFSF